MSITRHWTTYLFYTYLAVLVWLPLPLASRPQWAVAFFNMWVAGMSLAALAGIWRTRQPLPDAFRLARWPLWAWGLYCLWLLIQNVAGFSINPFRSQQQFLLTLSYVQLFLLTLFLVDSRERLRLLLYVLVGSGVFQALYGGLMALSGVDKIWWIEKIHHRGLATGTFRNRNHLANYLVMCLAAGCGLLVASQKPRAINTWRQLLRRLVEWLLSGSGWLRLLLAAIVIGVVLTHSRMGNASLFISLTIVGMVWLWRNRRSWKHALVLVGSLLLVDTLIVGTWFGLDEVVERVQETRARHASAWIENELAPATAVDQASQATPAVVADPVPSTPARKRDEANELRDEALPQLIRMARDHAFTGIGLGNFSTGFTEYNRLNIRYFYNEAHCDYLQFVIETGLVGVLLLAFIVLYCAGCGGATLWVCHSRLLQGAGFTVSMVAVASLLHAWVEFNFQSTVLAAMFVVIMGLGVVSRSLPDRVGDSNRRLAIEDEVEDIG